MKIKVVNISKHPLPQYTTGGSAGIDLKANLETDVLLMPMQRFLIPTGIFLEIPVGFVAQIRPGSGLGIKNGIAILNSPGTFNADYRGEICIVIVNLSSENFVIKDGERICQLIIAKHEKEEWINVENLVDTERGIGEFVHTGKK